MSQDILYSYDLKTRKKEVISCEGGSIDPQYVCFDGDWVFIADDCTISKTNYKTGECVYIWEVPEGRNVNITDVYIYGDKVYFGLYGTDSEAKDDTGLWCVNPDGTDSKKISSDEVNEVCFVGEEYFVRQGMERIEFKMKNLKRVVITTAIVCGIVSMSGCQKKENESKEITWAKSSEVVDNTDEHLQNMYEKYQLKKDYMLYLKAKNLEEGGTLYQIERNGKQQIQLLDDVCQFVEIGNKIFYTKPERADDLELIKELCVYDRSTKKSEKLLGLKDDLRSMISVKNNIVYYKTYDKVVAYDVDKQTKEEMDYMITSAVVVTCMVNGKIVIAGDGCVDMIDFDKKKVKKIVSQTECANDAVACTKDAVYYGVDSYNMNDVLQKEKIQSKNNGLWKFDLQTGNKEKIREQSPKELHVLGNKLYDESLKEVS